MLKHFLIATIFLKLLTGHASASVTYSLKDIGYSGESVSRNATLGLSFTISDAAVARGVFNFSEMAGPGTVPILSGDIADFISAEFSVGPIDQAIMVTISTTRIAGFRASLNFTNSQLSGTLSGYDEAAHFSLGGSSSVFIGEVDSDFNNCNDNQGISRCFVNGSIVQVREPNAVGLFAIALAGFIIFYRKEYLEK